MQFVADLEANDDGGMQIMYGIDGRRDLDGVHPRPPERLRRRPPGADRQRCVRPAPERRLRRRARRRSSCTRGAASACLGACGRSCRPRPSARRRSGGEPDQGIWEARGEPQHYVSSKLMCWVALDRAAKLADMRGDAELRPPGGRRPTRSTPTSSSTALSERWRAPPALRHRRPRRLDAARAALRLPPRRRRPRSHASVHGHRRRADRERLRPALPHRRDRRRAVRQGGHVPHLLVLAGVGAVHRRRARSGPGTCSSGSCASRSPLGLYAEEFDVDTGFHLGNFPQAFSHLALIEAAGRIIVAERLQELS